MGNVKILLDLAFFGTTIQTLGEVMIALTVLSVHFRMWQEHRIDSAVFQEMKKERIVGILAVAFIIIGYLLQLTSIIVFER